MRVELQILDPRLPAWGFPKWGSALAAGLDLHACLDEPLMLQPQAPPVLISAGIAFRIGDPDWCGLVLPRSGLGHREGLVLGNTVGLIDADYEGPCLISAWNRNPPQNGAVITIHPGDRIAQLVFTRIARPELVTVANLMRPSGDGDSSAATRAAGGFGSTGVKATCSVEPTGRNSPQTI